MGSGKGSAKRIKATKVVANTSAQAVPVSKLLSKEFFTVSKDEHDANFFTVDHGIVSNQTEEYENDYYGSTPDPCVDVDYISGLYENIYNNFISDAVRQELKSSPVFAYAFRQAVISFQRKLGADAYIEDYDTEKDFYHDYATNIILNDYSHVLDDFGNKITTAYNKSINNAPDVEIINDAVSFTRHLPKALANASYSINKIPHADIIGTQPDYSHGRGGQYKILEKNAGQRGSDMAKALNAAPRAIVRKTPNGRYKVIHGKDLLNNYDHKNVLVLEVV